MKTPKWSDRDVKGRRPRVHAEVHPARAVDYATDVVTAGSRFIHSRPTYDQ